MGKTHILVCGATGFIGRNLVDYFSAHEENIVTAVWHERQPYKAPKNVIWIKADLLDWHDVNQLMAGQDIVIQAAATTSGIKDITAQPTMHVTDNAVMNSLLLRAAYEANVGHFIFFSCTIMYPQSEKPVAENDFTGEILEQYFGAGWTKIYIERMCEFYARLGRTKHTVIRHSNIYGPYDKFDFERSHVFGATISKVMTETQTVSLWGSGEERRDLLYVEDLMNFVDLTLTRQTSQYKLYNCGSGRAVSVKDLAQKIIECSGKQLELHHDLRKPTIPFSLSLDCGRAKRDLGWQSTTDLEQGIALTIKWWKQHIDPISLSMYEKD